MISKRQMRRQTEMRLRQTNDRHDDKDDCQNDRTHRLETMDQVVTIDAEYHLGSSQHEQCCPERQRRQAGNGKCSYDTIDSIPAARTRPVEQCWQVRSTHTKTVTCEGKLRHTDLRPHTCCQGQKRTPDDVADENCRHAVPEPQAKDNCQGSYQPYRQSHVG